MARITELTAMEHMKRVTGPVGGGAEWLAKIFAGACLDAVDAAFRFRFRQALNFLTPETNTTGWTGNMLR